MMRSPLLSLIATTLLMLGLSGCSPEVGSETWCQNLDNKPKGDWTANEATDYAKHCIFKSDDQ